MYDQGKIKIAFFDCCYSGKKSDMAAALGMFSSANYANHDQILIGWKEEAWVSAYLNIYNTFVKIIWNELGSGTDVGHAVEAAIDGTPSGYIPGENITYQGPDEIGQWALIIYLN